MSKSSRRPQREVTKKLKRNIKKGQTDIRHILTAEELTIHNRTAANNRKHSGLTLDDEKAEYEEPVKITLRAFGKMLPTLIDRFSKIHDPRNQSRIKYKIAQLMLSGLFLFLYKIESCRKFTADMTAASVFDRLKEIYPELAQIPHASTLTTVFDMTDPEEIQEATVLLIKQLIRAKKFKHLLIKGCLPLSIDGTQKVTRDGELNDPQWLHRTAGKGITAKVQQYVFIVEMSLTFCNGLRIPLLTEFLRLTDDHLENIELKQDCELSAFYRIVEKLMRYFPRTNFILLLDNLYANKSVCDFLRNKKLNFMIKLPRKLKELSGVLDEAKDTAQEATGQIGYRERRQQFYFVNNIEFGDKELNDIHLIASVDQWDICNEETGGEIKNQRNEHRWISSMPLSYKNAHELCNLAARKRGYIEDEINTAKHRGFNYTHIYAHAWNAMKAYHYLMRLAQAVLALIASVKLIKQLIRQHGWGRTLKLLYQGLATVILPKKFFREAKKLNPSLRLDLLPREI